MAGIPIESGSSTIGGSNPIDSFALELADDGSFSGQNSLVLSFTNPLAYISFFMIDAAAHQVTAGTETFSASGDGAAGDSALFHGISFDVSDNVTEITWLYTSVGNQGWGIDNIGYGFKDLAPVPLPAALPLFGTGLALLGISGWRRRGAPSA